MKRLLPLSFHAFIIAAIIALCHCLFDTEALAASVDAVTGPVDAVISARLNPQFGLKDEAMTEAQRGIRETLPLLVRDDTIARELGFDNATQIGAAKVSEELPFLVFEVYLTHLQKFPTSPPSGFDQMLLKFTNQVLQPITVNKKVKSSLTLRFFGETKWQVRKWGSRKLIQVLTDKRGSVPPERTSFLVQVPALNRDYLGYIDNQGVVQLVTLFKDQYFDQGVTKPAVEVFTQLAVEARTADKGTR